MSPQNANAHPRSGATALAPGGPTGPTVTGWDPGAGVGDPDLGLRTWTGPVTADLGGRETDWAHAGWWWLGCHGGSGVSSLAAAVPGGADANRRWPDPAKGGPHCVVLVARGSGHGLRCLRGALRQHAAGDTPPGLYVAGTVVVADRPGRTPRHLTQEIAMLAGIAATVWRVPWLTDFVDCPDPVSVPLPPALHRLDADLGCLRPTP